MTERPQLFHRLDGTGGETVLLVNGIAMTAAAWEPVAAPLREHFRVLGCDLRGQLMSPGTPPANIPGHAADLARLLDVLELRGVHVLATSFGAAVASVLAARWPQRVATLALVAASDGFDQGMAEEVARWREATLRSLTGPDREHLLDVLDPVVYSPAFLEAHGDERALRRRQVASLPDAWFEGLASLLATAGGATVRDALGSIQAPTLVVAAELDGFIPLERTRALAEAIPGARFEVIRGAGHAVVVEQPGELARLYLDFIREHVPSLEPGRLLQL